MGTGEFIVPSKTEETVKMATAAAAISNKTTAIMAEDDLSAVITASNEGKNDCTGELFRAIEGDNEDWMNIAVSIALVILLSGLLAFIFEFLRRKPAFGAVYDQRRKLEPWRVPAPIGFQRWGHWWFVKPGVDELYLASVEKGDDDDLTKDGNSKNANSGRKSQGRNKFHKVKNEQNTNGGVGNSDHRDIDNIAPKKMTKNEMLIHCVGLDSFAMLSYIRFAFEINMIAFAVGIVLMVVYSVSDDAEFTKFSSYTISNLQRKEQKGILWIPSVVAFLLFIYICRRLEREWEIFMEHRLLFLADKDVYKHEQYSCLIERIPESHRSDEMLYKYFNGLFPGKIRRACVLLNTKDLEALIAKRMTLIQKYEDLYASEYFKNTHEKKYLKWKKKYIPDPRDIVNPSENCVELKKIDSEIDALTKKIEREHQLLMEGENAVAVQLDMKSRKYSRKTKKNNPIKKCKKDTQVQNFIEAIYKAFWFGVSKIKALFLLHYSKGCVSNVGFIEFADITTKQAAMQCNLHSTANSLVIYPAPDMRDLFWNNINLDEAGVNFRKAVFNLIAGVSAVFLWPLVIDAVTGMGDVEKENNISGIFYQNIAPIVFSVTTHLSLILLRMGCLYYVRLKTSSRVDEFMFGWNFVYQLVSLFSTEVKSVSNIIACGQPSDIHFDMYLQTYFDLLNRAISEYIPSQATFYIKFILWKIGTQQLLELAQFPRMLIQFLPSYCQNMSLSSPLFNI
mmetsp:Transcript_28937/g.66250  ORF Transcript_28937/g.66250 Transcript_28937/m.66250 type:complete len:734 (-) Transcript_28937:825-3026(-)